jgi:hypothetical protein
METTKNSNGLSKATVKYSLLLEANYVSLQLEKVNPTATAN